MTAKLLEVAGVRKSYFRPSAVDKLFGRHDDIGRPALNDVSLEVGRGEVLGIVGESGSGKSTLAKCIALLERTDAGTILFDGLDLTRLRGPVLRRARRRIQVIFQDPYSSLNPRLTVGEAIREVLLVHKLVEPGKARSRAIELLELVGLPASSVTRYPSSFSGGQRQRICFARALAASPDLLIADEPVSALDVSIQAQVLNLLLDLRQQLGLAMIFISHNLFVVQYVTPRIGIMFGGRVVELISSGTTLDAALHPYTRALLAAAPTLSAESPWVPDATATALSSNLPLIGCPYRDRCPKAFGPCSEIDPQLLPAPAESQMVACHFVASQVADREIGVP